MTIVSPLVGRLVGRFGARMPILAGLAIMILGLVALVAGGHGNAAMVLLGLGLCGFGGALCLTPITSLAMTSVPPQRAGMASGIMSAQRAIGSTIGFAVLGSVLAAWLAATLEPDLATVVTDPAERQAIASTIVKSANPRAHVAEIGPRQPITHPDPAKRSAIVAVAERDFVQGIRAGLSVAIVLLAVVLLVGWRYFPRGDAMLSDAQREAVEARELGAVGIVVISIGGPVMQRSTIAVVAASIVVAACATADSGGGWTTLIDGTSGLANFNRVGEANWSGTDGAIQATQGGKDSAFLVTKYSYRDFVIRVEFWASDDANSGVFMRCQDPAKITDENCYEANIFDQRPDPMYATGAIVKVAKAPVPIPKAGGKWNTYEITAKGQRLVLVLNGVTTVDVEDAKFASGPIALQWARGTIKFRKVEIRSL